MAISDFFSVKINPDWKGLVRCIMRRGTPERVHNIELFLDEEIKEVVCQRFGLVKNLNKSDPYFKLKREIAIQRFLGYDYVRCGLDDFEMSIRRLVTDDTAAARREAGREYINEHKGPIANRQEFEQYAWPDPDKSGTWSLEWYEKNLPDDMCIIGSGGFAHFAEYITWLMGYETLCYALFETRDLVTDISNRLIEIYRKVIAKLLQFSRVRIIWGSDDMGFRGGPLISPDDLREFVFPGHRLMAQMSHDSGRPYLLHSCGKLDLIIDDLIDYVRIDARHSFEDTIEDVVSIHKKYGHRVAHLGGIDVDFLCRSGEAEIRARVRHTLDECFEGGGYCLGTGNSVANYIPVDNYLAMLDEGRNYGRKH
jgi:uroporphyrinogen decarboxylase